jgi:hypothetical protein
MGYGHRTNTAFYETWGERPCDIAEREGVSIHGIGMRIHNFGNPYQRVKTPCNMEIYYGITNYQMLLWTRVPQSILTARLYKMISDQTTSDIPALMRASRAKYDVTDLKSVHRPQVWGWLMPEHENYSDWWQAPEYVNLRVRDLLPEYKIAEAQSNVKSWKDIKNI